MLDWLLCGPPDVTWRKCRTPVFPQPTIDGSWTCESRQTWRRRRKDGQWEYKQDGNAETYWFRHRPGRRAWRRRRRARWRLRSAQVSGPQATAPSQFGQVHLIPRELFDTLRALGYDVYLGELGENITTAGLELERLPVGTIIRVGATAAIELTGLRTPCVLIDRFRKGGKR